MAARKKKAAGKQTSRSQKTGTGSGQRTSATVSFPWTSEVLLIIIFVFCAVLFISNFGKGGAVGNFLSMIFFALFGRLSYIFPFVLFFLSAFLISNRISFESGRSPRFTGRVFLKLLAGILLYIFCCVLLHLIYCKQKTYNIIVMRQAAVINHRGGGLVGAVIGNLLIRGFGKIGCCLIIIAVFLFAIIMLTETSLVQTFQRQIDKNREAARRRKLAQEQRRKKELEEAGNALAEEIAAQENEAKGKSDPADGSSSQKTAETNAGSGIWEDGAQPAIHIPGEEQQDISNKKKKTSRKGKTGAEAAAAAGEIGKTIRGANTNGSENPAYVFPDIELLTKGEPGQTGDSRSHLEEMSAKLQQTLDNFGVKAHVTNVICGPTVTQYEIHPEMGVKVSKILNLTDDIKLNLAVSDIRIEAPIPGKSAVGIEVPNKENVTVALRDLIESREFARSSSKLTFCVGKDIAGNGIVADIAKMPHLLIAGATGSGKSVCINTIIVSILYNASPEEVKMIMIDPKVVELSVYNPIPHLLIPVVTDPKKAAGALQWAVTEMMSRYSRFAEAGVRDIEGYNRKANASLENEEEEFLEFMPQIVVIVDELSDLMMVAQHDVEDSIVRLSQLARAAGIHLIIATQRPSVNVITGLIKANMPSRIAFAVTSGVDSRTILDMNGAEKLLGKGDMLFYPQGYAKPVRIQGAFVSDKEVADVVNDILEQNGEADYDVQVEEQVKRSEPAMSGANTISAADGWDPYFADAGRFLIEKERASIGMLQRYFKIGFNRAARIVDQLEEVGVVGPEEGTKPRRILMTMEEFEQFLESS